MPKIVDHEERRQAFARAAMDVAIEHGVDALTIRSVAGAAQCSTGALAHYFATKDDLLIAVQRAASEGSLRRIEACFERQTGPPLLEAVMLSVLPLDEARRGEWRLWLAYFARAAQIPALAEVQQDFYGRWLGHLRAAYRGACGSAAPTRAQAELATDATMTFIQGLGVLGMFGPAGISTRRQRQLVREHLGRWLP